MSKIILYQCDMCKIKSEELYTLKVKIPIVDSNEDANNPDPLLRNEPDKVRYNEYDLCEDCVRKLDKFIQTFHNADNKETYEETQSSIWFIEYNSMPAGKKPVWTREAGPFTNKKEAEAMLGKQIRMNNDYQHRISCKVVPAWVVDFIDCNFTKG